jgi:hypothetical protein
LGSVFLPEQLKKAGLGVIVHDDVYVQTERDPWIFYECGKKGLIVITSDTLFMKSFPHRAAIALGKTTVLAFSNNNFKSSVRGTAFIAARKAIEGAVRAHKRSYFIGVIGMQGTFRIKAESPLPERKTCHLLDWDSYERVCESEGVLAFAPAH